MTSLNLDFETRCTVDLRSAGLDNYSAHPSCRVLMLGWAIDQDKPRLWLPHLEPMPKPVAELIADPTTVLKAWNCVPGDTEVLTRAGWLSIADVVFGDEVMQWNPLDESLSFGKVSATHRADATELWEWDTNYHKGAYTVDHRMFFHTKDKPVWRAAPADYVASIHPNTTYIPVSGDYEPEFSIAMSTDEARLMEIIRADGSWASNTPTGPRGARFSLRKGRKVERLYEIAARMGFDVSIGKGTGEGVHRYDLRGRPIPENIVAMLGKEKRYDLKVLNLSLACRKAILDEARFWDGSTGVIKTTYSLSTSVKQNAEMFQIMAHTASMSFKPTAQPNTRGFSARTCNPLYVGTMRPRKRVKLVERAEKIIRDVPVYCVTVPTGAFLMRRKGTVSITGNCQFERTIMERVLKIKTPPKQWRCTMVRAMMLSLPGGLSDCGTVLRLGEEFQKSNEGSRLIRIFCVPHKPTKQFPDTTGQGFVWYDYNTHPTEWVQFCKYCLQDVNSERRIGEILAKFPIPEDQWTVYALDQKINDRGVPIDMPFVHNAIEMYTRRKREIKYEMRGLTGLENPNSTGQLLPWVRAQGYPFNSLGKNHVKKALEDFEFNMTPLCARILRLRLIGAKTSVNKFKALAKRTGADGRLRFSFQMAGAGRTGRWAGRGVQLQNLPRPLKDFEKWLAEIRTFVHKNDYEGIKTFFGDPILVLSSSVRTAIAAPPGRVLRVADLNAIETRLIGWICGCEALNKVFADGLDPYKVFATDVYDVHYDDVTKEMRGFSKPGLLGCGFMLSAGSEVGTYPDVQKTGLWAYAESMGVKMSRDQAAKQVEVFRSTYHEVKQMWAALMEGAMRCINERKPVKVGVVEFDIMPPFLRMKMPNGRCIYYLRPKVEMQTIKHPGGSFTKMGISYEGKNKIGMWTRVTTHGGKFVENICQFIAREVLVEGLLEADRLEFDIVLHCHDEIGTEEDEFDDTHSVKSLEQAMSIVPSWAPGLLLGAAGYESDYYRKD